MSVHRKRVAFDLDDAPSSGGGDGGAYELPVATDDFRRRADSAFGALRTSGASDNVHARAAARADANERAEREHERDEPVEPMHTRRDDADLRDAIDMHMNDSDDSGDDNDDADAEAPSAAAPAPSAVSRRAPPARASVPQHVLHPERYTKYSLEDVETDAHAERASALSFLTQLRECRSAEARTDGEDDNGGAMEREARRTAAAAATKGRRGPSSSARPSGKIGAWRAHMDSDDGAESGSRLSRDGDGEGEEDEMTLFLRPPAPPPSAPLAVASEEDRHVGPPHGERLRGQNKHRPRTIMRDEQSLCQAVAMGEPCAYGEGCRFNHDVALYLVSKEPDLGERCVLFDRLGRCPFGYRCRFLAAHLDADGKLAARGNYQPYARGESFHMLSPELQKHLQRNTYPFPRSARACAELGLPWTYKAPSKKRRREGEGEGKGEGEDEGEDEGERGAADDVADKAGGADETAGETAAADEPAAPVATAAADASSVQEDGPPDVPLRNVEKKQIDFRGKLYLAPLTTVGNLPFRRICKAFGVDITCGEMAVAQNVNLGTRSEWALLRRHESEDLFGVQIAGGFPDSMMRCAEIINEHVDCDFVDINMGCPIDMAIASGYGSALLKREKRLKEIVAGMLKVLDKPLTVKLRTGYATERPIAHKLLPELRDMGIVAATLHGRSKQQHYSASADWDYIRQCAAAADPLPLFGNGDVMSHDDYERSLAGGSVAGVMIARGALIKPWVFTEIKERRLWDISASERFDMLRTFCNHGLEHWGSDTQGVNKTRRFLLEWQSFLHRYVPVGVLERVPQRMNDRAPPFVGRNDLETLMASPLSDDWIKLSEMLLGKAPPSFVFKPKHKANTSELVMAREQAQG